MKKIKEIPIKTDKIQLDQFLKWSNIVESGGKAKKIIQAGKIRVNDEIEYRRGKKLEVGDIITLSSNNEKYKVSRE
ncbi:MAG: RNA-binding S4 domain-containing protein [Halanaerobiales bacterium]